MSIGSMLKKATRLLIIILIIGVISIVYANPSIIENETVKIIASFEEGIDKNYNETTRDLAPHFWTTTAPNYSYTPADVPSDMSWYKNVNYAWEPAQTDNVNWWNVLPDKNGGTNGHADMVYQLNLPGKTNYENWSIYNTFRIKWFAGNPSNTQVNLQVFLYTKETNRWVDLGYRTGNRDTIYTWDYSLSSLTSNEKKKISQILFRTFNTHIPGGNDYNKYQRNHIYSIKVLTNSPPSKSFALDGRTWESKYLGTVLHRRYGTYSATGFYDSSIGKYRLWFGSGIPEANDSDNVYYTESATLKGDWPNPTRTTLNHYNILKPYNQVPGWGGDPSVIKVGDQFIMYFSGLKNTDPYWNRIYRAVSNDGVNWTLNPTTPVVDASSGGIAGYGSGCPSVVYKDGIYYLYYYSQFEQPDRGWTYRRTSTDGINFGAWTALNCDFGGADVKYVSSINKWVLVTYRDPGQDFPGQSGGVRCAVSSNGTFFAYDASDNAKIAQDDTSVLNHNPGFIGTPEGHGFTDMYITYGINEFPLTEHPVEYNTRQLGYSSLRIK